MNRPQGAGWTGGLGSLLLGLGAVGVGWLPPLFDTTVNPLLDALRNTDNGQLLSHIAVVVGGALLLQAWLLLGSVVLGTNPVRVGPTLAVWTAPLLVAPPLFSRDVYSYIAQGRLLRAGLDPYTHGVAWLPGWFQLGVDPAWADTPTPYGPLFLALQSLVVGATDSAPWWSMILFRALSVVGVGLIAAAVVRLARLHGIEPNAALWLSVLNPLVLMHLVLAAHNDALMIAAMCWAFVFGFGKQPALSVLAITAAMGIKPIAVVALPFVVLAWLPRSSRLRQRITQLTLAALAALLLLWIAGRGLGVGLGWVAALTTPGAVRTLLSPATALGQLIGLVASWFGGDILDPAISVVRSIAMAVAVALVARLLLRPHGQSPLRACAVAFTIVVLLSPVVQPWYLLWALPLVAAVGLQRAWHLRTVVVATGFFVLYAVTESNVVTDSQIGWEDVWSTLAALLVVVLVLLASPAERQLALGAQFTSGLRPRDAEAEAAFAAQIVRADPPNAPAQRV